MDEESPELSGLDVSPEVLHAPKASPIPIEAGTNTLLIPFLRKALMWSRISFSFMVYSNPLQIRRLTTLHPSLVSRSRTTSLKRTYDSTLDL